MTKNIFTALILSSIALFSMQVEAKLSVATTTTDLEAIVKALGGDQVEVFAVTKGTQDPHQIEAKPSFMVKFHKADLVISHGLELESAWLEPLIQGSRNSKIHAGTKGFLEVAKELDPIEVVHGAVSRAEGDVHPDGNPHFQLDPVRVGQAAVIIADRLGELDTSHRNEFQERAKKIQANLKKQLLKKPLSLRIITFILHQAIKFFQ